MELSINPLRDIRCGTAHELGDAQLVMAPYTTSRTPQKGTRTLRDAGDLAVAAILLVMHEVAQQGGRTATVGDVYHRLRAVTDALIVSMLTDANAAVVSTAHTLFRHPLLTRCAIQAAAFNMIASLRDDCIRAAASTARVTRKRPHLTLVRSQ